jgi:ubiquinone/menaquinone biosynthesis C-methylase UbiE
MPDVYATIEHAAESVQERLADVLELRAADLQQRAMLEDYLKDLPLPVGARILEIGCGTGAVARTLARRLDASEVVGLDPGSVFIEQARRRAEGLGRLAFVTGDGRDLPFDDSSFDAVVCHTALCHIPGPERVLAEALRVTRPIGWLAVFDGDYATTTVAISDHDPLQACVDAAITALVHDRWLVRRLPTLVHAAGWQVVRTGSYGYVETTRAQYMLTLVDRGADTAAAAGTISDETAESCKKEARRRVRTGTFFGHIAYASLIARKLAAGMSRAADEPDHPPGNGLKPARTRPRMSS